MADLEDGKYLIKINPIKALKTLREFQNEYFALVDTVVSTTGSTRYEVHEAFKNERKIETTKDFNLDDWVNFIEAFKWYYFNKADILL